MPEYALAIDHYGLIDGTPWLYVQEYAAPASIDPQAAQRRRAEALSVLTEVTGVTREHMRLRLRQKHSRGEQYSKIDAQARFHVLEEGGLRFRVNFDDYLDTGLFLDHRLTRARVRAMAAGKRFLNLFCYTGSATVYAAAGGARASISVDLSRGYLQWQPKISSAQRSRETRARFHSQRLYRVARRCDAPCGAVRPHLPGSTDVLELQAHARCT